jgi:hypothetical protein
MFEELLKIALSSECVHSEGDNEWYRMWYERIEGNDIIVSFDDHGKPVAIQVAGDYEMYYPAN